MRKRIFFGLVLIFCGMAASAQVTPESFGCKGDSITDDTENLQKAIDFCKENNRLMTSSKGKVYAISHPLDIINPGEMQIDFGGAEIRAIKTSFNFIMVRNCSRIAFEALDVCTQWILYQILT